ncbi:MAG: hypothetical protein JOZ36_05165 [Acidobacteria bacterium]|nr:hypothetical protein [Acidobacteriota bacterium]
MILPATLWLEVTGPGEDGVGSLVEQCDGFQFREEILSLFERNAQPLSAQYFDWYYGRNGSTDVLSWVLRRTGHRDIVGLCSVVQRRFRFRDTWIRAGVVGNLMADENSRPFGSLALLRSVQSLVSSRQFDILLSMPKLAPPRNFVLRMGFRPIAAWQRYVQIFRSRAALDAHQGAAGAVLSPLVDSMAALRRRFSRFGEWSRDDLMLQELTCDQITRLPVERWPGIDGYFVSDFSAEMLVARFLRQPFQKYQFIGIVSRREEGIHGFLVIDCRRDRTMVFDCRTNPQMLSEADAILTLCRSGRRYGDVFGVITLRESPLSRLLQQSGFITVPGTSGASEYSLLGFWRTDHPLARHFERPSCWNVFHGFSDV